MIQLSLCVVNPQLARDVVVVGGVALGWDACGLWLLNLVVPALLLAEVNSVFLGTELERSTLHVVTGRSPAHQRVLPSCGALEDIKVDTPHLGACLARRVGGLGRAEDTDGTLVELL